MKKTFFTSLVFLILTSGVQVQAQNTFPATGSVGIGTTTPSPLTLLHLNAGVARKGIQLTSSGDANAYSDFIWEPVSTTGFTTGLAQNWHFSHRKDGYFSNSVANTGTTMEFYANKVGGGYFAPLSFKSNGDVVLVSSRNATPANVGIGTTTPTALLSLGSTFGNSKLALWDNGSLRSGLGIQAGQFRFHLSSPSDRFSFLGAEAGTELMTLTGTGNLGIGTTDTKGYKLGVNGAAIATSMTVKLNANWPDFVFAKTYGLRPLAEVESYIQAHSHLPEVPSAAQVAKDGINLGEMDATLLKKIEELTLYMIEMKKENEAQNQKIQSLEKQLAEDKK
jgi:hypothetical protein